MANVTRRGISFSDDPQVEHHAMVAVEHDMAVRDEVAREPLVACSKSDPQVLLEDDRVLPFPG